jgi:alpha-glucosidase (family GH31 glycosyl hydrolase)
VVGNYSKNGIPLDVMWTDIDYMNKYRNFEYDTDAFNKLPQFVDDLHKKGMRYIPIFDAGTAMRPKQDYDAYNRGVE